MRNITDDNLFGGLRVKMMYYTGPKTALSTRYDRVLKNFNMYSRLVILGQEEQFLQCTVHISSLQIVCLSD